MYQLQPNEGKKRKADASKLSLEKSREEGPVPQGVGEQELGLLEIYREQHQKLAEIVTKLHNPMAVDNIKLLRDAHECLKVMIQMTQRLKSETTMEMRMEKDTEES